MQKALFALSLGFAGVILAHQAAWSQTAANCGKRAKIVERLEAKYGETRQSMGLAQNNGVVEVFASDESGTWTIVITLPNGMTCLVAAGNAFQEVDSAPLTPDEKA